MYFSSFYPPLGKTVKVHDDPGLVKRLSADPDHFPVVSCEAF